MDAGHASLKGAFVRNLDWLLLKQRSPKPD
jgi:hypothetical protein